MERDQDERASFDKRSSWLTESKALEMSINSLELYTTCHVKEKSLGRVRRTEARLVRKEKVVGIEASGQLILDMSP